MKKISTTNPLRPIAYIIGKFNLILFIIIIASGLVTSIIVLNNILIKAYTKNTEKNVTISTTFDQQTIDYLSKLETIDKNTGYQNLSSSSNNPFSE